jgi:ankyrin repeat protein
VFTFAFAFACVIAAVPAVVTGTASEPQVVTAVKAGDLAAVRALVQKQADVNAREADGTTALHWAVRAADQSALDLLVAAGADVNAANRYGVTPLSLAAKGRSAAIVAALLKAGADLKAAETTLPDGQTLLMHAARVGDVATLRALVGAGGDVNARETRTGTTAAMWAAAGNRAGAVRVLAEAGADLNVLSKMTAYPHTQNGVLLSGLEEGVTYVGQTVLPRGGWSAAMFAAREGAADAARALADAGANLDLQDPEGTTALIVAVINGHYDVMSALLEKGADPNVADIKGMTPLYAAVDMHTIATTFGRPDPPRAVIDGAAEAVRALLARGADPNARLTGPILKRVYNAGDGRLGEGATPFMRASRTADLPLMKILVAAGADPKASQKNGNTPLMLVAGAAPGAEAGDDDGDRPTEADAIAALEYAIGLGLDLNAASANGDTVMHTAVTTRQGNPAIIRFLAANGARLDLKNKAGRTPLDVVLRARERSEATVAVLRELGPDTETPAAPSSPAAVSPSPPATPN